VRVIAFDEMRGSDGEVRTPYAALSRWLGGLPPDLLDHRRREAELIFRRIGITFAVYGEADSTERLIPFDVIPRILAKTEWDILRGGYAFFAAEYARDPADFCFTSIIADNTRARVTMDELVAKNRGEKIPFIDQDTRGRTSAGVEQIGHDSGIKLVPLVKHFGVLRSALSFGFIPADGPTGAGHFIGVTKIPMFHDVIDAHATIAIIIVVRLP